MTWLVLMMMLLGGDRSVLKSSDFQQVIDQYLKENLHTEGVETEYSFRSLPNEIVLPKGEYSIRVAQTQPLVKKGYSGIPVEIVNSGKVERVILCSVFIRTFENVFVIIRPFEKNEEIDASFLAVSRVETTTMNDAVTAMMPVAGLRTKRMVKENTILQRSFIEEIPAVKRDQPVSILVKAENLTIGSAGIAKEDGLIGEEILVQRAGTRETVRAKIVGQSIVEIEVK
ncbi:MAG: flagellar basal body P-ring formation chaperone FlgA [Bacteroidota bacterium]